MRICSFHLTVWEILVKTVNDLLTLNIVLFSATDWSVKLSNFENVLETPFEFGLRMLGSAKLLSNSSEIVPYVSNKLCKS